MSEHEWKDVCGVKALKGNRALVSVPDKSESGRYVAIIRHRTRLHAIDATCYHMGGPLLMADIEEIPGYGSCITCPWHRYQITLEKGLKVYQGMTGEYTSTGQCKQRVHEVKIENERVFVKLNMSELNVTSDDYAHKKPAPAQGSGGSGISGGFRSGMLMGNSSSSSGRPRNSVNQMISNSMRGGDGAAPWSCSSEKPPTAAPAVLMPTFQHFKICEINGKQHPTDSFHLTLKIKVTGAAFSLYGLGKHVEIRKTDVSRFYTPYTTPTCSHDEVLLLVKCYPKGKLSPYITSLKVGDKLEIRGPMAGLTRGFLDGIEHVNMVCGGTGITPLLQILSSLISKKPDTYSIRTVTILLSSSDTSECQPLTKDLKLIQASLPFIKIQLNVTITRNPPSDWSGLTGRITPELLSNMFPVNPKTKILCCGSDSFNESISNCLGSGGIGYKDDEIFIFC